MKETTQTTLTTRKPRTKPKACAVYDPTDPNTPFTEQDIFFDHLSPEHQVDAFLLAKEGKSYEEIYLILREEVRAEEKHLAKHYQQIWEDSELPDEVLHGEFICKYGRRHDKRA
jgi:hypothetical protein